MRYFALFFLFALAPAARAAERPNVVVILTDDQGWGDLSINGNTNLRTPHLDALATEGARVERFFVQPVCSPTRAEFLTGRWHPRGGVAGVSTGAERLNLSERTIADAFRAAGYATACFGKWHNGSQFPYHPNGRGFAEYYGFTSGHWGEYFDAPLDHNGKAVKGTGFSADDFTSRAIDHLKKQHAAKTPAFVYLALNTPHSPMQVPQKYWERFEKFPLKLVGDKKEDVNHTRAALEMCENIDDNIGRLLAALKELKIERDTIVVYFNDNGPNGPRWNGGMKGRKGSTDEGGVRSPLHVYWPGRIKPGTVVALIGGAIDLYPTLAALANVKPVGDKPFDGISFAPWLLGESAKTPERVLFGAWNGRVSARDQRFRLDANGALFDMTVDPNQTKNVAKEKPDDAKRLLAAVEAWKRDVYAKKPEERPFTVGYREFPRTVLPARDGVPKGGVKRSANAPNCSFFTNWTKPDDAMTWNVEVNTAGRYEAIVHYTCAKGDVGATLELALGAAKWTGTVSEAFDPPLRGAKEDRVPRQGESYVKDFKLLSLGVVEVPTGRGTLTLCAPKVAGAAVADVRAIELVLVK